MEEFTTLGSNPRLSGPKLRFPENCHRDVRGDNQRLAPLNSWGTAWVNAREGTLQRIARLPGTSFNVE